MAHITESELLEQVRDALVLTETEDGAMTVLELAEALNISAAMVRVRLRNLLIDGAIELVRVRRRKMNGIVSTTVAYASIKK